MFIYICSEVKLYFIVQCDVIKWSDNVCFAVLCVPFALLLCMLFHCSVVILLSCMFVLLLVTCYVFRIRRSKLSIMHSLD
jgi:hypothetical protein